MKTATLSFFGKIVSSCFLGVLATGVSAADVARVYATTSDKGVRVYRVDDTRTWTLEKTVVVPGDGHVVKPVSCVHGADCFYVLDGDSTTSTASFSIHRYDEQFAYIDTLVSSYTPVTAPDAQQMAISPDGAYLYVACFSGGVLYRVATADGTVSSFATAGINQSRSVSVSMNGTVYVANRGTHYVAAYDQYTGTRGTMYSLSSASGVFVDDAADRVYISNSGSDLKSYKLDGTDAAAYNNSYLGNALALTRVGDRIYEGRNVGHVVSCDLDNGTYGYAVTGIGTIWQLTAEAPRSAGMMFADGTGRRFDTLAAALAATAGANVVSISVMPEVAGDLPLVVTNVVFEDGKFGLGTRFNRALTAAERAVCVAEGLHVREMTTTAGTVWEVSGVYDVARVYATVPGAGVKSWLVDCTNGWVNEGTVLDAGDGHVVRPMAIVRIGSRFHVLDRLSTSETKFSIHRYGLDFRYIDTPVRESSFTSPNVQQMAVSPDGAYLYVTCFSGGSLLRVNVKNWSIESFATLGINNSRGISVSTNGTIYVANRGANYAAVYDKDTGTRLKYHALNQASGVWADDRTRCVYVTSQASILKVFNMSDAAGVGGTEYTNSYVDNAYALARVGDFICIGNSTGRLSAFDPESGTLTSLATGLGEINHLYADLPEMREEPPLGTTIIIR